MFSRYYPVSCEDVQTERIQDYTVTETHWKQNYAIAIIQLKLKFMYDWERCNSNIMILKFSFILHVFKMYSTIIVII